MTKKKAKEPAYPQLLHVTIEDADNEVWYQTHTDGMADIDEHGKSVAVYKLVSVGVADITREYIEIKAIT